MAHGTVRRLHPAGEGRRPGDGGAPMSVPTIVTIACSTISTIRSPAIGSRRCSRAASPMSARALPTSTPDARAAFSAASSGLIETGAGESSAPERGWCGLRSRRVIRLGHLLDEAPSHFRILLGVLQD